MISRSRQFCVLGLSTHLFVPPYAPHICTPVWSSVLFARFARLRIVHLAPSREGSAPRTIYGWQRGSATHVSPPSKSPYNSWVARESRHPFLPPLSKALYNSWVAEGICHPFLALFQISIQSMGGTGASSPIPPTLVQSLYRKWLRINVRTIMQVYSSKNYCGSEVQYTSCRMRFCLQ